MREGLGHDFPYVDIVRNSTVQRVVKGTFSVLADTGVVVQDKQMQHTLAAYGCRVDTENDRVRMDEKILRRALASAPSSFEGQAMDPSNSIRFKPGETTYFINGCGKALVDADNWRMHDPTREEFYRHIRVIDALPNIDIQNCFPFFGFAKVPECMRLIESAAAKFRVSSKVQIEGTLFDNYRFTSAMADLFKVDLFQIVNSAAPLTYYAETADQMRNYTEHNLPFHFATGVTRGMTGPMTSLGSVILNNAEALAGIVMAQALKEGARVWVNSMMLTPNMNNGMPAFGDMGNSITDMAFNQVWRHLGIPCWSNAAAWTSSKMIDYQAGYELTSALVLQVLSGATAISFQGGLHDEIGVSTVKAVIDDDVVASLKRLMRGVNDSDEGLAVDLINEVGPLPGSYLESDLTLESWRDECHIPTVGIRDTYNQWVEDGKQASVVQRAKERLEQLIAAQPQSIITESQEQDLEYILNEARNHYRKKGLISDEEWHIYQEDLGSTEYPFA
jgi:trimethylamine--corrinoid protein Co-methyltransferase